jgi:hypothetical protein
MATVGNVLVDFMGASVIRHVDNVVACDVTKTMETVRLAQLGLRGECVPTNVILVAKTIHVSKQMVHA